MWLLALHTDGTHLHEFPTKERAMEFLDFHERFCNGGQVDPHASLFQVTRKVELQRKAVYVEKT